MGEYPKVGLNFEISCGEKERGFGENAPFVEKSEKRWEKKYIPPIWSLRARDAGSRAAREPPPAKRCAQPSAPWQERGCHCVTCRPRCTESSPHGSGGFEAEAGSRAARDLPSAGRCARPAYVRVLPKEREALQELDAMANCLLLAESDPRFALSPLLTPHNLAKLLPFPSNPPPPPPPPNQPSQR